MNVGGAAGGVQRGVLTSLLDELAWVGKIELTGKSEKAGTFIAEMEPTKGSFWNALWEGIASGLPDFWWWASGCQFCRVSSEKEQLDIVCRRARHAGTC